MYASPKRNQMPKSHSGVQKPAMKSSGHKPSPTPFSHLSSLAPKAFSGGYSGAPKAPKPQSTPASLARAADGRFLPRSFSGSAARSFI
jgi:hypothetical protein